MRRVSMVEPAACSNVWWMVVLRCRSAPRQSVYLKSGYWGAKRWVGGKRDCCLTAALVLALLFIAIFVGGPLAHLRLSNIKTSVCISPDSKLTASLDIIRNMTNYSAGVNATDEAVRRMTSAFANATVQYSKYNESGADAVWPEPYEPSEEETLALEEAANKQCPQPEYCVKIWFVKIKCTPMPDIPCPDIEATEKLEAMSDANEALDIYGDSYPTTIDNVTASAADDFVDAVVGPLQDLVARINIASMAYVGWLAFVLVFVPPVFRIYG